MMDWGNGGGWWWMLPMMMFMIVVVGAVVWGIVALTRSNAPNGQSVRPTAEDILSERFARGEIDASEYRERIDALHGSGPTAKR